MKKLLLAVLLIICFQPLFAQVKDLKVGDVAPSFADMDQHGKKISLEKLLEKGKVVLVFYRGNWCPYCNKELKHLEDSLALIMSKGATLVAVTPEMPEYVQKTIEKTGATYSILYDKDLSIMDAYAVTFKVDEEALTRYKNVGIDIRATNGGEGNKLPVPAVYIIGQDKKIKYVFYDPNYRNRASVKEILANL